MSRGLHPKFERYVRGILDVAQAYRLHPRVTSQGRSLALQARLYEKRQRGEHPFPVALPGCSWHNYGLAVDLVSDNNEFLGAVWRSWGGQWSPNDPVHYGVFEGPAC